MRDEILGMIRHSLTYLGGTLVTHGFMTASDLNITAGAITTLVGIAWSVIEKRLNRDKK